MTPHTNNKCPDCKRPSATRHERQIRGKCRRALVIAVYAVIGSDLDADVSWLRASAEAECYKLAFVTLRAQRYFDMLAIREVVEQDDAEAARVRAESKDADPGVELHENLRARLDEYQRDTPASTLPLDTGVKQP